MSGAPSGSVRALAEGIVRRLQDAGFAAFFVGGCVRDEQLGREPGDFDIATNAVPSEIERLFPKTIPVGRQFGVMVVIEAGRQFQVATFRAESDYRDGRHPRQVSFGDPQADAARRDFTINGLFFDPVRGELRDWVGGAADLAARVVRTIGRPEERFAEDHLRLLRAVRFAAQLGFAIEPETWAAIRSLAPRIRRVSAERVRDELLKVFAPGRPFHNPSGTTIAARGLDLLHESGLLAEVLPEIAACVTCEQSPDFHPEGTVFNHLRLMFEQLLPDADPLLPWCVLLHDVAKPRTAERDPQTGAIHFYGHERVGADLTREILGRLRFPRKEIETVATVVRHHMQFRDAPNMRMATRRRMLLRPTFRLELELHRLDCLGSHGRLDIYEFLRSEAETLARQPELLPPLLTGHDLKALGVPSGRAMGVLLREVRDQQLAGLLRSKEAALAWVKTRAGDGNDAGSETR
ncbi:MAG: CCA tRNA nucleotidyltransferase [Limisphaerales bacterium]